MAEKRAVEIDENERKLRAAGGKAMAGTKPSLFMAKSATEAIELKGLSLGGFPVVVVKGPKKLKFHFHLQDEATVQAFFAPLMSSSAAAAA